MKKVVLNSLVSIVLALTISACSWKSPYGYTHEETWQIARYLGYDYGYRLGPDVLYDDDIYNRLLKDATDTYFGEPRNNEDRRIYREYFLREFHGGMIEGINDAAKGKQRPAIYQPDSFREVLRDVSEHGAKPKQ